MVTRDETHCWLRKIASKMIETLPPRARASEREAPLQNKNSTCDIDSKVPEQELSRVGDERGSDGPMQETSERGIGIRAPHHGNLLRGERRRSICHVG